MTRKNLNIKKGASTKDMIKQKSRIAFNDYGLNLKIDQIASFIGCTKSNLTNHFPTKESLLTTLAKEYDEKLTSYVLGIKKIPFDTIQDFVDFYKKIMLLQYDYRSAILYTLNATYSDKNFKEHISISYSVRVNNWRNQIDKFVNLGLLSKKILEEHSFSILITQCFTMSVHWLSFLSMYDAFDGFEKNKSKYLKSIFYLLKPYLTEKGELEFSNISFE